MALTFVHIAIYILVLVVSTEAQPVPINVNAPVGTELAVPQSCCKPESITLDEPTNTWPWNHFRVDTNSSTNCSSIVLKKRVDTIGNSRHCWPKESSSANGHYHCSSEPSKISTVSVILSGIQNKYSPTFCDSACKSIANQTIAVKESAANGATIGTVTMCDQDLFITQDEKPKILTDNDVVDTRQLGLSQTIEILLKKPLDYEEEKLYTINMIVTDRSKQPKNYSMVLTLNVEDEDDQGPIFTQKVYHCNISEGTYNSANPTSCVVKATDQDKGINTPIGYSILDTGTGQVKFSIDANGHIHINGILDRETLATYVLPVKGFQLNSTEDRFNYTAVVLTITDKDDNLPKFKQKSASIDIVENTLNGTIVYQFTATDADEGPNAVFKYQIDDTLDAFQIDETNGKVKVKNSVKLDRETHPSPIHLQVYAVPTGKPKKSSPNATLTITLLDVNDNSPKFKPTDYNVTIKKNCTLGEILTVHADDADDGLNSQVKYTIIEQPSGSHFSIDPPSGKVSLNKIFSDHFMDMYYLVVQAEDKAKDPSDRRSTTVLVKVHVKDVNIHRPTITVLETTNVLENAVIGTTVALVNISDRDVADTLTVTFTDGHGNKFFSMSHVYPESSVYEITVKSTLDREAVEDYSLTVSCSDGIHKVSQTINIIILDEDDNPPIFQQHGNFSIMENKPASSVVGNVMANDDDAGENANISFTIDPRSQWTTNFTIDASSGQIRTRASLDREALGDKDTLSFLVLATDHGKVPLTGTTTVTVKIGDKNDNPPAFAKPNITLSVDELSSPAVIYVAKASDPDFGNNKIIKYSFGGSHIAQYFSISPSTGTLSTSKALSYENGVNGELIVPIVATDKGSKPLSSPQQVLIKIKDVNDHKPQFIPTSYTFNISETTEPGSHIGSVTAADKDILPENKDIQYHLDSKYSAYFRIDISTGKIFLVKNIDVDAEHSIPKVTLEATAANKVPLNSGFAANVSAQVVINITPVNEYAPQFSKDEYACSVKENYAGPINCTVSATDKDSGQDGRVTYSIVNSKIFSINHNGLLTLKSKLNYENVHEQEFHINVSAADGGSPQNVTYSVVIMKVLNENDCKPVWKMRDRAHVTESIKYPPGQVILQLRADDDDGTLNKLTYRIDPAVYPFQVHNQIIILDSRAPPFDYENKTSYTLQLYVNDTVHESKFKPLIVEVAPMNEFNPVFNQNYLFKIQENSNWNGNVKATDRDTGNKDGTVHYSLDIPNGSIIPGNITLSPSGILTISKLNREEAEHFTFTVLAIDGGSPPLTGVSVVQITVTGVDEYPPYYLDSDRTISLTVNEATQYNSIFTSKALDKDVGTGSEIQYKLVSESGPLFSVSPDGHLTIKRLSIDNGREVDIQIQAYNTNNTKHNATQNIKIHVQDINNKVPHFVKKQYKINVSECEHVGHKVLSVTAVDKDVDLKYNTVTYWIGSQDKFTIDKVTGDIRLNKHLDFDPPTHEKIFNFKVYATDLGTMDTTSNHTTSTNVTITVQNCNDNVPIITPVLQRCDLLEETTGHFSCNITATDVDNLNTLQYSIVGSKQKFTISHSSGLISAPKLDYDLPSSPKLFILNVSATDSQFSSFATVLIELKNTNDNKPVFQYSAYNFTVPENVNIGYLGDIIATDADGDNISYSMTGNCSDLDMKSGRLLQKQSFDFEKTQVCNMVVKATDGKNTATAKVKVTILDANDNAPKFQHANQTIHVNEAANPSSKALMKMPVHADDKDGSSANNKVTYSIRSGNIDDAFKLNPTTGALSINKPLNASILQGYTIVVEAKDSGSPSLSDSAVITIIVDDVNDNRPWFLYTPYMAQVTENTNKHALLKLFAQDSDPSAQLTFALQGTNPNFNLVNDTLHVNKLNADTLKSLSVSLVVTVSDGQYTSSTTVKVTIVDVNDNAPQFNQPSYQKKVNETATVNTTLLKIHADDKDVTPANNKVTYTMISGNIGNAFKLDPTTGALSINKPLNASILQVYTLVVEAKDDGSPSLSNTVVVTIDVKDVNNNSPWFLYTPYMAQVTENTKEHVLLKLFAQDSDPDAVLTFTLKGNSQYFYIIGDMLHVRNLDAEVIRAKQVPLEITVRDGKFHATTTVQVTILDENDHYPYFTTSDPFSLTVKDTTSVGTPVVDIHATDDDYTNSDIMYFLYNSNGYFNINRTSGQITLQKALDVNLKQFDLSVVVFDGGSPLHSNETNVVVNVRVTNKDTPTFVHVKQGKVVKSFKENVGNQFVNLTAVDKDPGPAGHVSYSITSYSEIKWPHIFTFNNVTGILTINDKVDFETTNIHEYSFEVKAMDHATFSKSATALVIIHIVDVDEAPVLSLPTATIYKELNATAGSVISSVTVDDKDTAEHFRNFTFSISPLSSFFQINSEGVITAKQALTAANVYNLTITVTDGGGLSDSKVLKVTVSNITGFFSNTTISENLKPPVEIEYLPNITHMTDIIYTLDKKESSRNFAILKNGTLVSNKTFDRETTPQFFLDIKGHKNVSGDMILKAQIQMQVTVLDVNDNPPVFNKSLYTLYVNESTTIDTQIGLLTATDDDEHFTLIYSIVPRSDTFRINPTTGQIYLQKSLDYESAHKTFNLQVICNDTLNTGNSTVKIDVLDANDNSPAFKQKTYIYNISESHGKGSVEGAVVKATDPDTADQGHLQYTVVPSGGQFGIDNHGQLILKHKLDFDTMQPKDVNVTVKVQDTANHSNTTTVIFHILDANDNAPDFTKSEYTFHVLEGMTVLGNNFSVEASDNDSGENAEITYSLGDKDHHQFNISTLQNEGFLHILEPLDRESVLAKHTNGSAVYTVTVIAKDHGNPQQTSTALVHIYVDDVNDCPPQFNNPNYTASVQEGTAVGTKITMVTTTDCDYLPEYKQVTYTLHGPDHEVFNVTTNGDIVLNTPVSVQKKRTYNLNITASDGVNQTSAHLTISVLDANDHSPNFTRKVYTFNVSENVDSTVVGEVQALDEDPGENGNVSYAITSGNSKGFFDIIKEQNNSALIKLVSALDREAKHEYSLIITASDNAKTGKRQGTCTITVEVMDLNDNNPVFDTKAGYSGSIGEEAKNGTQIEINPPIHAHDQDSGSYGTEGIVYSLEPPSPFCINSSTAVVQVCGKLDREKQSRYKLQVWVKDTLGKPGGKTANTSLTITVTDYNDEVPVFINTPYTYTVLENTASGTSVGDITVIDADENGIEDVQVTILHGSLDNFYISSTVNGSRLVATIYVSGVLDRERKSSYNMTVAATDSVHTNETSVIITVLDVNDNAPVFNSSRKEIRVEENSQPAKLYTVTAYDRDQPNTTNSEIKFAFSNETQQAYGDKFKLFKNGSLYTRKELDREAVSSYILTVIVKDKGTPPMNASTSITVTVLDVNDHTPSFCGSPPCVQDSYVVETVPVGSILALPVAIDPDQGDNGTIMYTILPSPASKYFTINNSTGLVAIGRSIVINTLLAENIVNKTNNSTSVMLDVVVEARDKGPGRGKASTLTLRVTVEQINDNAPVFEYPCTFNITEELPSGTIVGDCYAIIPNATHSHMTYKLITGFDSSSFSIDQTNGTIRTSTKLDREEASHYSLSVQVTDGRTPERTAFTAVTITVQDINDNSPVFYQSPISLQIPENSNWSRSINASAVDRDEGQNGTLMFTIDEDFGGLFAVDNASGIVTVSDMFDYEKRSNYTFHVLATDHGTSPMSSSVLINITVIDVNDNTPTFTNVKHQYDIPENTTGKVFTLSATDKDSGYNGKVQYSITHDDGGPFIIYPLDGAVYIDGLLDYETKSVYHLTFEATDEGLPPRSSTLNVTIHVLDVYDYVLKFPRDVYETTINASTEPGRQILNLAIQGAHATYRIEGQDSEYFAVSGTGAVTVKAALGVHNRQDVITVVATNKKHQIAKCKVIIYITGHEVFFPKNEFNVSLPENLNQSSLLLDLNTTEENTGQHVLYTITGIEPYVADVFRITPSNGKVYCDKALDRETEGEYSIYIAAYLSTSASRRKRQVDESSTTIKLTVHVDDEDDNPPTFSTSQQALFGVPGDAKANYIVTQIQAYDPDLGENGRIVYSATGDTDVFGVDKETGEVTTLVAIASKPDRTTFNLTVTAQDPHGGQGHTLNVQILVVPQTDRLMLQVNTSLTEFRRKQNYLIGNMSHLLGVEVQLETVESHHEHTSSGTKLDISRTDMYFHGINQTTGTVVPSDVMMRLISKANAALKKLFGNDNVVEVREVKVMPLTDPSAITVPVIALISVAIFIFFGSIIAIILAQYSWTRLNDERKALEKQQQAANYELNDFEMGTLKSHKSHDGSQRAATAAVNPVFQETDLDEGVKKREKKITYETQELCMNFPDEPFRFSDEIINNNNNGARSVADSALENTSLNSNDQHKSESSGRTPEPGTSGEDPKVQSLKVEDGPVMTSSPRISRDVGPETHEAILRQTGLTDGTNIQIQVVSQAAELLEQSDNDIEEFPMRNRVLTLTMESGETETDDDGLIDDSHAKSVETAVNQQEKSIDTTEGTSLSPVKSQTGKDQARSSLLSNKLEAPDDTTIQAEASGTTDERSSNDGNVEKVDDKEMHEKDEVTAF